MRDRALGATIRIYFTTHQLTGVVVAPSSAFVAADFKIYKDGSATEKVTTNGITVTSPFDSQTGAHLVEIDTGNATGDSGFWASGSAYRVVLSTAKTVDSKDPSGVCVGEFSIELQTADVRKFGGTEGTFAAGIPTVALDPAARVKLASDQPDYDLPTNTELNAALAASDDATLAAIAAEAVKTSEIKAKTDNLPADPADQSLVENAITNATALLATPAQVNAQVLDVLSVDTFAELTSPPAATSSLKDKLTWLFMYARNKVTQTATQRKVYLDDGTTVAGTSTTSDNGTTFTKGEDA